MWSINLLIANEIYVNLFYLHSKVESTVRLHVCTKHKIAKLGKRQEDYGEHYGEAKQVLCTRRHCRWQLHHCSVETNELEHLQQPQQEKTSGSLTQSVTLDNALTSYHCSFPAISCVLWDDWWRHASWHTCSWSRFDEVVCEHRRRSTK